MLTINKSENPGISADNSGRKIENTTTNHSEFPFKIKDEIGCNFYSHQSLDLQSDKKDCI